MNMLSLLIGIVGTIFTIFFGYYAIRLSKKEKKFKKLDFIPYECYSLFDSAVKRLKIGINYKETPISNSLILFKGKLRNNGTIDLDSSSIYEPVGYFGSNRAAYFGLPVPPFPVQTVPLLMRGTVSK